MLTAPGYSSAPRQHVIRFLRHIVGPLAVVVVACYGCSGASDEPLADPTSEAGRTALVQRGHKLFDKHGCGDCHGAGGHGDGRIAQSLQPPPRDFRKPDNFRHGYTIDKIADTIRDGIAYDRRVMPRYAHLTLTDRQALAYFIRSLAVAGSQVARSEVARSQVAGSQADTP